MQRPLNRFRSKSLKLYFSKNLRFRLHPVKRVKKLGPGGNVKTQKTGNFLGKRVKSLFFRQFFSDRKFFVSKIFVFAILIYPPSGNVKTQKTGNFPKKRRFWRQNFFYLWKIVRKMEILLVFPGNFPFSEIATRPKTEAK